MYTLLQLIIPAFLLWLIWKAFRSPRHRDSDSSGPCDTASSTSCSGGSQGRCNDHGSDSCDGSGDGDGGGD